ncbi:MAG TPA: response regulator [Candidatus Binatia bacterium]|jgi:DNA-binding response OmpR family regulator|nr:response regulator [Candidatus Binatia bacterium]
MILLVEDDSASRYALARILRNKGYEVIEATDGNEAFALFEKSHFDLVITDLKMPNQTGLVLIARIRVKWPNMPILLMSGFLSEAAGKLVAEGLAKFIHKPIEPEDLVATVQRLLRKSN